MRHRPDRDARRESRQAGPYRLLSFVRFDEFTKAWSRLGLDEDDLIALENDLLDDPESAPVVAGTGGLRKRRFSPPSWNRGKRGATRVGYVYFRLHGLIYLIVVYSKSDAADIPAAHKRLYKAAIESIAAALSRTRAGR